MKEFDKKIIDYLGDKNLIGALLINGPWGSGKTFTIKHIKRQRPWYAFLKFWNYRKFIIISLFGIKDIIQFNYSIRSKFSPTGQWLSKVIGFIGIAAIIGFAPTFGEMFGKWLHINNYICGDYEYIGLKFSVIISAVLLVILILIYFYINRDIAKNKENIFVFDDFERGLPPCK